MDGCLTAVTNIRRVLAPQQRRHYNSPFSNLSSSSINIMEGFIVCDFICTECDHEYLISDIELWEVYEEDGKETEFTCTECEAELVITSSVIEWKLEAELNE